MQHSVVQVQVMSVGKLPVIMASGMEPTVTVRQVSEKIDARNKKTISWKKIKPKCFVVD